MEFVILSMSYDVVYYSIATNIVEEVNKSMKRFPLHMEYPWYKKTSIA